MRPDRAEQTVADYEAAHPVACESCRDSRLKLGGWMGPTPVRRYPDPCPDCSPGLAGRELQAAFVEYVTEPGRFTAEGQAQMLLEPAPELPTDRTTARWHGVYCPTCDFRTTFTQLRAKAVATCNECGTAGVVRGGQVITDLKAGTTP